MTFFYLEKVKKQDLESKSKDLDPSMKDTFQDDVNLVEKSSE